MSFSKRHVVFQNKKVPAASLKRRKHALGLPIHINKGSIVLNIRYYIIWVLNRLLYINYIEFPNRIRDFPSNFVHRTATSCLWPRRRLEWKGCSQRILMKRKCYIKGTQKLPKSQGTSRIPPGNWYNGYIIAYLIPILYKIQYLIPFISFLYGLVCPTHVYGVSGLPQVFVFGHAPFGKDIFLIVLVICCQYLVNMCQYWSIYGTTQEGNCLLAQG